MSRPAASGVNCDKPRIWKWQVVGDGTVTFDFGGKGQNIEKAPDNVMIVFTEEEAFSDRLGKSS